MHLHGLARRIGERLLFPLASLPSPRSDTFPWANSLLLLLSQRWPKRWYQRERSLGLGDDDFSFFSGGRFFFARSPTSLAASSTAFVSTLLAPGVTFPLPLDACAETARLSSSFLAGDVRLVPPSLTPFLSLLLPSSLGDLLHFRLHAVIFAMTPEAIVAVEVFLAPLAPSALAIS